MSMDVSAGRYFCQVDNRALAQLCAFCSLDRRKESANLCYGDVTTVIGKCHGRRVNPLERALTRNTRAANSGTGV